MYYPSPIYFQQLEERIQKLEAENRSLRERLEKENQDLKQQLEQIKPLHIENINYKIQELSVKELKGTLNIGMTALTDPEEIQKWMADSGKDGDNVQLHDLERSSVEDENEDHHRDKNDS